MKVVFLDVDWVLIRYPKDPVLYEKEFKNKEKLWWLFVWLTKECMSNFVDIVKSCDAYIVVSSSWRIFPDLMDYLCRKLKDYWIPKKKILWTTSIKWYRSRQVEILEYVNNRNEKCEDWQHIRKWLVIDDDDWDLNIISAIGCLLKVDWSVGLRKVDAARGIMFLNSK